MKQLVLLLALTGLTLRSSAYTQLINGSSIQDTIRLADPTIFLDRGTYYLYGTSSDSGFLVYQSADLKKWSGPAGKVKGYALAKGASFGNKGFWAPQVFKYKNTYYMAYTADENIAIAKSNSPLGPFTQQEHEPISGSGKQIDPYVFFDTDGKVYMYHVKLRNGNRIYVSELKPDLSDVKPETSKECISAASEWENTEKVSWPVAEGPTVLKKDGNYYLFYSANDFRNPDYAVGYAVAKSPYGPWTKFNGNPVLSRKFLKASGTGHGDFFTDKKGVLQYVFHTHHSGTRVSPRSTALVSAKFVKGSDGNYELAIDTGSFKFLTAN